MKFKVFNNLGDSLLRPPIASSRWTGNQLSPFISKNVINFSGRFRAGLLLAHTHTHDYIS
jgi:hypothetical protein